MNSAETSVVSEAVRRRAWSLFTVAAIVVALLGIAAGAYVYPAGGNIPIVVGYALVAGPLGIVLGAVGLLRSREPRGKDASLLAIGVSVVLTAFWVVVLLTFEPD